MSDLSILPPNSTKAERALESALAIGAPDLRPVGRLMNPDLCPADLLGWLAWAFSVDVWDDTWNETQKRAALVASIEVHRRKGTKGAVISVLQAVGFDVELEEWFEYGGPANTVRLTAFGEDTFDAGFAVDPALFAQVRAQIDAVKPLHVHLDLRLAEQFTTKTQRRVRTRQAHLDTDIRDIRVRPHLMRADTPLRTGTRQTHASVLSHDITPRPNLLASTARPNASALDHTRSGDFHDIKRKRFN